ncbi:putative acid anhydride hydrolase Ecym_6263 [Eremothecium cymbalariae DBVPG|uniref:Cation-transporting ATPase n=1 Tax=Eremothecium cymbalariae (strain CBS 270.75 / DBVPG 7215 / KCTC 17166 / NRRL Y-17582) TaxID=931890 RepID=G8JVG6_ERECY|nr:hypothetical protein Ecym_6263 [Eremothecium cymbalariae DBVPG\
MILSQNRIAKSRMSFNVRKSSTCGMNNDRPRPSFSSSKTSLSSITAASSTVLERQNTEAYAGATFETVPSSVVSFHHPHSYRSTALGSVDSLARSRRNTGSDSLALTPLHSRTSEQSRTPSRIPHFRFFTEEQLENAQGAASTLGYTDYDTDWDAIPAYEQYRLHAQPRSSISSFRNTSDQAAGSVLSSTRGRSSISCAVDQSGGRPSQDSFSRSSQSSSQYSFRARIPVEVEEAAGSSHLTGDTISDHYSDGDTDLQLLADEDGSNIIESSETQNGPNKKSCHTEYLKPQYHERFYPQHNPHLHFQRFYIAEEDFVIGIAGFKTSIWKKYSYNIWCWLTFGLLYLICKWIPRYKVKLCGTKTLLGKAEWVVVENQYGELSIIDVKREWYNRPLSTIFPLEYDPTLTNYRHYHHESESNPNVPIIISFEYRYLKLIYSPLLDIFQTNSNWTDPNWVDLDLASKGLPTAIHEDRVIAFGKNSIRLKQKDTSQIFFEEALHPFYVFQIFSIILWMFDEYYFYAACIFIISAFSIMDTIFETKQSYARLFEVSHFHCDVRVYKDGFWTQVSSSDLVPGDIYEISDPSLSVVPCDSVLISGDCLTNESMLTGESVPVSKVAATVETMHQLLEDFMDTQVSGFVSKSFLFNGTKLIRVRPAAGQSTALAMAVRTGFSTTKGGLVRSMVFPKPIGFKFYEDSFKYLGIMALVACFGFFINIIQFISMGLSKRVIILRGLDIVTIVIPPALPASLSIGTGFALNRLKKKGIFCITPTRLNIGGKIDVMCFDKTGTLTEDGLTVLGVHFVQNSRKELNFSDLIKDVGGLCSNFAHNDSPFQNAMKAKKFFFSLLTCHSLRVVNDELIGDPLDFKMFQFTKWTYAEDTKGYKFSSLYEERHDTGLLPENSSISPAIVYRNADGNLDNESTNNMIGIVRSFEFLPQLRRMSVIVKPFSEKVFISFTKGAPEVIADLCNRSSLPEDYDNLLNNYTHKGYRVISCAGKVLNKNSWLHSQKVTREEVESDLEFLGFIIFENRLKSSTKSTLESLNAANIRTIMCTGDNVLTAISVGREANLINNSRVFVASLIEPMNQSKEMLVWQDVDRPSEVLDTVTLKPSLEYDEDYTLAITGDVFRVLFKNNEFVSNQYLNNVLLKCSIYARMSPDEKHELVEQLQGLNYAVGFCGDGANDCGALKAADIGVSLSDAEASVAAPFTSQIFEISCVLDVIKEGRAALVTSFACFQYMSLYSAIQFITINILYSRGINLADFQFLYIDLFLIVPIAIFMSWSKPYSVLAKKRPSANLVSPKILVPFFVQLIIIFVFQIIPWYMVQKMPWYIKPVAGDDNAVKSSDNTVLFFVSNFQYILIAIVLSVGPPYREPISKNFGLIADVVLSVLASLKLMYLDCNSWLGSLFFLTEISPNFKLMICGWVALNCLVQLVVPGKFKYLFRKKRSSKKYKNILREQMLSHTV